ncbi:MAG: TonB-dependent receptor [Gammaproteobacteria bacterium]|nr:TonB-dependent receptor [Gammaproteobacteria bacterium]
MIEKTMLQKVLGLLLLSNLAFPAIAQVQTSEEAREEIEVIEVIRYRESLRKNIAIKRESDAIVDAASAEDIGQFPDLNVADALQRITGVQVEKDERDGEGVRVSIRGTPSHLNLTLLNNQQIATATASNRRSELRDRSFNYYLLPTEVVDTLEVYKSPEANVEEGSMGGTVIVRTRRPLDADANSGAVQARYFDFDNAGENKPLVSGLYSWKNDAETFGFNLAFVYRDSSTLMDSKRNNAGFFRPTDYNGDGVTERIPVRVGSNRYTAEYNLRTPFVTLQFAPTDDLDIKLTALNSVTERESHGIFTFGFSSLGAALSLADIQANNLVNVSDGTAVSGNLPLCCSNRVPGWLGTNLQGANYDSGVFRDEVETTAFDLEATLERGTYRIKFQAGHSFADGLAIDKAAQFSAASILDFDLSAGLAHGNLDPSLTPEDYLFHYSHINTIRNDSDASYAQADTEFNLNNSVFSSIEAGVKYREYNKGASRVKRDFIEDGTLAMFAGAPITDFRVGDNPTQMWQFDIPAFEQWQNGIPIMEGTGNSTWNDPNDRYNVNEEVTSAYLKGNFETENFRGNVGLRAVRTSTAASAKQYDGPNFNAESRGAIQDVTISKDYTDILPSLNLNYVGFDDVVLRFAAAQVMARPNYINIAPFETLNCGSRGCTGFEGNPDLEPFRSNQYDVSAEWYFDDSSLLALTLFHKDVDSYIDIESFSATRDYRTIDENGTNIFVPREFAMERPINGDGLTIQGFEFNYVQDLAYGFGVTANYTYADVDLTQTEAQMNADQEPVLFGHSQDTWNATAFYDRFGFQARFSYTFRSEYPSNHLHGAGIQASSQQAVTESRAAGDSNLGFGVSRGLIGYKGDFGQLDFNASYDVSDNMEILLQVINLLDEEIVWYASRENHTPDQGRPIGVFNHGRRLAIGVNARF